MIEGIIFKALSGFYYVDCNGQQFVCRARGRFRHDGVKPLVGDRVAISVLEDGTGAVDAILPRKNEFQRPAVANIDLLIVVCSGAIPETDPFLIDRVTALARRRGCESAVCFNKWDLAQPEPLCEVYVRAGFPVVRVSAETGEGIPALAALTAGKICAFTGNSGVGKSSLLNALDSDLRLSVGEVSEKLGRGRHTTRHVELLRLKNGAVAADTPGFSSFDEDGSALDCPPEELGNLFQEFAPYLGKCQFLDCAHWKEKGCAVLAAVERGEIAPSRHRSYVRLYEQGKAVPEWQRKERT